jgi:hypothetical protein
MRYAIEMNDGSVAVMETLGHDVDPADEVARWPAKEAAKVVSIYEIDETRMPPNREFRGAWEFSDGSIKHNMTRVADMHMAKIRAARNGRLAALDVPSVRALSGGDQAAAAAVEAQKQTLRDLPQTYETQVRSAKTVDDVKAIWPAELGGG